MIRILSIRFEDDGTVVVDWAKDSEQSAQGGMAHTTWISPSGQDDEQISYYIHELRQDASELVAWWERAQEQK